MFYYVDYVNTKQKNIQPSIDRHISNEIIEQIDEKNDWRGPCERNQRAALIKHQQQPFLSSWKIRGEDNIQYTIQMMNIDRKKPFQTRLSLIPHRSSTSKFSNG